MVYKSNQKGYQDDFSMSNRAREAYDEKGLLPASKITGIPSQLVSTFVDPQEWHHTGSKFNKTNFYNPHHVRVIFGLEDHNSSCGEECQHVSINPDAVNALHNRNKEPLTFIHPSSSVEWTEFPKNKYGGKGKPVTRSYENVWVEQRGDWAHVELPDGSIVKKKVSGNYFKFTPNGKFSTQFDQTMGD
jgi:hypothetical protein